MYRINAAWLSLASLVLLSACADSPSSSSDSDGNRPTTDTIAQQTQCLADSPWLKHGEGLHGSSAATIPEPAATASVSSYANCASTTTYRFGVGKADITGAAAGKILLGIETPTQYTRGIYTRQYARSFITASDCNNKRAALVVVDTGLFYESERKEVIARLQADPVFQGLYNAENVMINATHTHSGPGGQAHHLAYNTLRLGHDAQAFEVTVAGIVESLRRAHLAMAQQSQEGQVLINHGELTGANKNRAIPAYMNNPEQERAQYIDDEGQPIFTPRLMSLLKFIGHDGSNIGSLNWFGVHPTSDFLFSDYGGNVPISGDNKGYAAINMERIFSSNNSDFVSAFSQADEGDSFTDLFFDQLEERERHAAHLPQNEPAPVTVANGQKQLLSALQLYTKAQDSLNGPVDYRLRFVEMDQVEITDEYVLASLQHPTELDANPKRTCAPALGVAFGAGGAGAPPGEVQGGFTPAGVTCPISNPIDAVLQDLQTALGGSLPPHVFAGAVGCNLGALPFLNLSCHAEKPVLLPIGEPLNGEPSDIPLQIVRLGNLAVLGLPWEVTTMAGRRLRQSVLDVLKHDGVDYVVINGLSNGYMHYLTTREEYAIQQYEGGSNVFGPWSLAAVQQEFRKLARDMINREVNDIGTPPAPPPVLPGITPIHIADIPAPGRSFGDVLEDTEANYQAGDTARVLFQASSPNSDLKTGSSFLFVERQIGNRWDTVAVDADTDTSFVWQSDDPLPQIAQISPSRAEILWRIPRNAEPGTYRIRFEGVANFLGTHTAYSGTSSTFQVSAAISDCR